MYIIKVINVNKNKWNGIDEIQGREGKEWKGEGEGQQEKDSTRRVEK